MRGEVCSTGEAVCYRSASRRNSQSSYAGPRHNRGSGGIADAGNRRLPARYGLLASRAFHPCAGGMSISLAMCWCGVRVISRAWAGAIIVTVRRDRRSG